MFVDYVALMLIDLVLSMVLIALYFAKYINENPKVLAPGMLMSGSVGLATGLHMIFRWPLTSSYNIAFGEPMVLFSALLVFTGIAILADWDLLSLGIIAFLVGIVSVIVGIRILNRGMTKEPLVAALGFVGSGVAGILALPAYLTRKNPVLRILAALAALGSAIVWGFTGYASYWAHLESFAKWAPK
jgi:putative membrane protein